MNGALTTLPADCFSVLLESARSGNAGAMGRLLEGSRKQLVLFARYHVPAELVAKEAPSDLVQETFLEAQQHFDKFVGGTAAEFFAWLRTILYHTLQDFVRAYQSGQKRQASREERLGAAGTDHAAMLFARDPSPDEALVLEEIKAAVRDCVSRLSELHQQVLRLRSQEGLSFPKAGAHLGLSEEAARKLCRRALSALGELLKERGIPVETMEELTRSFGRGMRR
jgi:RNA polymerase sigma-70 factor (ECF subfamily)